LLTIPPLSSLGGAHHQQEHYKSNTLHPKSASTIGATARHPQLDSNPSNLFSALSLC